MIDSIKFFNEIKLTNDVLNKFNANSIIDSNGIVKSSSFMLKNLKIVVNDYGTTISNSIHKYYHNHNFGTYTRKEIQQTIQQLSNELEIDVSKFKVIKLDIATNVITDKRVQEYLIELGSLKYFQVAINSYSKTYYNHKQTLIIYDKIKELESRKQLNEIPAIFLNKNVCRIELRFIRNIKSYFGKSLNVDDLYSENCYLKMIDMLKKKYFQVSRNKTMILDSATTIKEFKQYLQSKGLETIGILKLEQMITNSFNAGIINSVQKLRLNQDIKQLTSNKELFKVTDNIKELDSKFKQSLQHYR